MTPSASDFPKLLAAGTATYGIGDFDELSVVPTSLQTVVEALASLQVTTVNGVGAFHVDPDLDELCGFLTAASRAGRSVIVYYTGHGSLRENESFYLILHETEIDLFQHYQKALPAAEITRFLTRRNDEGVTEKEQPYVLVILDCCFSSGGGEDMLAQALRRIGNKNVWVLASSSRTQHAVEGVFAQAFADALRSPKTGASSPYLSVESIADAVNNATTDAEQVVHCFPPAEGFTGTPPFFPNVDFREGVAGLTMTEQHWLSRLRGVPGDSATGFYLTGRQGRLRAAKDLVGWLTDSRRAGLAVVTGGAGTGKSALLSLPIYLSFPGGRTVLMQSRPDPLIVETAGMLNAEAALVSVHARGLNSDQLAHAIAVALGRDAETAAGLLEDLAARPPVPGQVVIMDGIDESPKEKAGFVKVLSEILLQPLAGRLKVAVGCRNNTVAQLGDVNLTIDLSASKYLDPEALKAYVGELLVASREDNVDTPYRADRPAGERLAQEVTAVVAGEIALRATESAAGGGRQESFLLGQLLARCVRSRAERIDIDCDNWRSSLPDGPGQAFDEELGRLEDWASVARSLLEALAWANGPGLPWEDIWVPVAQALADRRQPRSQIFISDGDVTRLFKELGAYIVEDAGPAERSVFRPFHQTLATHLRGEPSTEQIMADPIAAAAWQRRREQAHAAIVKALLSTVSEDPAGQRDWLTAHPYLHTYLAQHAAAAGPEAFPQLVGDLGYLATADRLTLTPELTSAALLTSVPSLHDIARVYRRARPLLGANVRANAAYLQETSHALTDPPAVPDGSCVLPLYATLMASVRPDQSKWTLTGHAKNVNAVAFGRTRNGDLLLAAASNDGTIRRWNPITNARRGQPLTQHSGRVNALAFGTKRNGGLLLATAGTGVVRVWTASNGVQLRRIGGHVGTVSSVAFGSTARGRLLLASGGHDKTVRLWDPTTGRKLGEPLTGHTGRVNSVAFGTSDDGKLLLASAGDDGTVLIRDVASGAPFGSPLTGHHSAVRSVAFGPAIDGELQLAVADSNSFGEVRVWRLLGGSATYAPLVGHNKAVCSVAFSSNADNDVLIASASEDTTVRVWDPVAPEAPEPPEPHTGHVDCMALAKDNEGNLLLAGGRSHGEIVLWKESGAVQQLSGHTSTVRSMAFGTDSHGHPLLASGDEDGTVRLWGAVEDPQASALGTGRSLPITALAFSTDPEGPPLLAFADSSGSLWLRDTPTEALRELTSHACAVRSIAFGRTADDDRLLAAVAETGAVWLWNLDTDSPIHTPLAAAPPPIDAPVTATAFCSTADGGLLLATGDSAGQIHLWDPVNGHRHGEPLLGKRGPIINLLFTTAEDELLLVAASDSAINIWDPTADTPRTTLRRLSEVRTIAALGMTLAVGDGNGISVIHVSK